MSIGAPGIVRGHEESGHVIREAAYRYLDLAFRLPVLDGVRDEIRKHLGHPCAVPGSCEIAFDREVDSTVRMLLMARLDLAARAASARHRPQARVSAAERQGACPRFGLCHPLRRRRRSHRSHRSHQWHRRNRWRQSCPFRQSRHRCQGRR